MSEAQKKKLIKVSTVPTSLNTFCYGQLKMLSEHYEVVAVSYLQRLGSLSPCSPRLKNGITEYAVTGSQA